MPLLITYGFLPISVGLNYTAWSEISILPLPQFNFKKSIELNSVFLISKMTHKHMFYAAKQNIFNYSVKRTNKQLPK